MLVLIFNMNKCKAVHNGSTRWGSQKSLTPTYPHAHRLTDIRDQQGNHIHYTLDLMGNRTATDIKDPSGTLKRSHRNVYNTLNKLSKVA